MVAQTSPGRVQNSLKTHELSETQYPHLNKHLQHMRSLEDRNSRDESNKTLHFADAAQIILETKKAIVQKVTQSIPENYSETPIFLIGNTGSGKSTTLCYLRGDEMVRDHGAYQSKKDTQGYISSNRRQSQTLIPNIEVINNVVHVDFGGFEDSHGKLINLGMELALKELLIKYRSKVLVLDPITNTHNRYANVAELGMRLTRLIKNKEETCTLGLTKYSFDNDFVELQQVEKDKYQERNLPGQDELALIYQIEMITQILNQSDLDLTPDNKQQIQVEKEKKQNELKKAQEERTRNASLPLTDNFQKQRLRAVIEQKEQIALQVVGLKKMISFDYLESSDRRAAILKELSVSTNHQTEINPELSLSAEDNKLLSEYFQKAFLTEQNDPTKNTRRLTEFKSFASLKKVIDQYSLMYALTHPEIGELLHLPEMTPFLRKEFDQRMIINVIEKYIKEIAGLNFPMIKGLLQQVPQQTDAKTELEKNLAHLEALTSGLLGYPREDEEKWKVFQRSAYLPFEDTYQLPSWLSALSYLDARTPAAAYALRADLTKKPQSMADFSQDKLKQYSIEIIRIQNTLLELIKIKDCVQKKYPDNSMMLEKHDVVKKLRKTLEFINNPPHSLSPVVASTTEVSQFTPNASPIKKDNIKPLKQLLSGPKFKAAGGFLCFRFFMPEHIKQMMDAKTFDGPQGIKAIAQQALKKNSPWRHERVQKLYEKIAQSDSAEEVGFSYKLN